MKPLKNKLATIMDKLDHVSGLAEKLQDKLEGDLLTDEDLEFLDDFSQTISDTSNLIIQTLATLPNK